MQINTVNSPSLAIRKQTRVVMIWKFVEYVSLSLFAIVVPRAMGPDLYGRFAALLSFIGLLTMINGLGVLVMFGRFVPEYRVRGERLKIQVLFTQTFVVRVLFAILLGIVFLLFFPRLLPEVSTFTVMVGAWAFFLSASAAIFYQFFYGLNDLGKWLCQDSLLKILLLIGMLILEGTHSLDRAALALFLIQLGFFLLGVFWTRTYFMFSKMNFDFSFLYEHLRFGLLFYSANLLLMVVWRAGEIVILFFSGKNTEVAYFNIANLIAMTVTVLISQLASMMNPSLTTLHISGKDRQAEEWLGYSLKYLTIASFSFLIAIHTLGTWGVKMVWGDEYLPVVSNLKILTLGLLAVPLIRTGISLAILHKQPNKVFWATATALAIFILVASFIVPHRGSYGASVAIALALWSAGVITYYQSSLTFVLSVACYCRHILIGFAVIGTLVLPSLPPVFTGLISTILYISLLFLGKVMSAKDIRKIGQVLIT